MTGHTLRRFTHQGRVALIALAIAGGMTHDVALASGNQSQSDVTVLQEELDSLRSEVEQLPASNARRIELIAALDALDDEVAYLRVALRRNTAVSREEINAVRRRIDGVSEDLAATTGTDRSGDVTVPVGTEMNLRLQGSLHSDTAKVEDRFYATLVDDLLVDEQVAIRAGAEARGLVSAVDRSSRTDRSASLTLTFDRLTADGRTYPVRLTLTESQESGIGDEIDRIGVGAGVGGVIGGLIGGVRGALAGILIGAGGTVAATEGEDVNLPAGTMLRVRFDSSVTILGDRQ